FDERMAGLTQHTPLLDQLPSTPALIALTSVIWALASAWPLSSTSAIAHPTATTTTTTAVAAAVATGALSYLVASTILLSLRGSSRRFVSAAQAGVVAQAQALGSDTITTPHSSSSLSSTQRHQPQPQPPQPKQHEQHEQPELRGLALLSPSPLASFSVHPVQQQQARSDESSEPSMTDLAESLLSSTDKESGSHKQRTFSSSSTLSSVSSPSSSTSSTSSSVSSLSSSPLLDRAPAAESSRPKQDSTLPLKTVPQEIIPDHRRWDFIVVGGNGQERDYKPREEVS
ncbi:hypothetical protein BGW38_007977, partial [Lunasporangiospora selenospora]